MKQLRILKSSEIPIIREELLKEQHMKCKICNKDWSADAGFSLDHQHGNKSEKFGEDGYALVRGILCRACNVEEGKIWNSMKRFGFGTSVDSRIEWLESLICYYKSDKPKISGELLIHPNEVPKEPIIGKREFNKLNKYFKIKYPNRKELQYPKSKKWNNILKELKIEMEQK